MHRPTVTRALVLVLFCAALAFVASSDTLHAWLLRAIAVAGQTMTERPLLGAVLFIVFSAVSAMLAFFSSAILVPVAVYSWGRTLCAIALWVGWTLGGMATYGIGRSLGRRVVESMLSSENLARYEDRISKRASFGFVLLFQMALPSEVPGYLLGLARYPFWKYLVSLMLAELPYAVGTVYLGESFLNRKGAVLVGVGAAGALMMAIAFRALQRRLRAGAGEG